MNISRLSFSGVIAFFCTSVLFPNDSHAGERESAADRGKPNMVIVLTDDLGERTNLVDQYPERARQMEARLAEILKGKSTR